MRISLSELGNRLAHHEALWKFQYEDPTTGKPDYNRPVFGLNASLALLSKHYNTLLELLYWLSPQRHQVFLENEHDRRFRTLCTREGIYSFIRPTARIPAMDISQNMQLLELLNDLRRDKMIRLMSSDQMGRYYGGRLSPRLTASGEPSTATVMLFDAEIKKPAQRPVDWMTVVT